MCPITNHTLARSHVILGRLRLPLLAAMFSLSAPLAYPQTPPISADNWGDFTAPVFGQYETGVYNGAELFAGPLKFRDGRYFHGVLPNGRIVDPAGISVQIGMNPLGVTITSDGAYVITSNDDEREENYPSLQSTINRGGYSLSVIRTSDMKVVSQIKPGRLFIGLQVAGNGPYTLYAAGGGDQQIKCFTVDADGKIESAGYPITIPPLLPSNAGYVTHYLPSPNMNNKLAPEFRPPTPAGFSPSGAQITYPAGITLSPSGKFLYVACNGDNSLAIIDTSSRKVIKQIPVGYFPYGVCVSADSKTVLVSNWGLHEYKFVAPTYDRTTGNLTALGRIPGEFDGGLDQLFFVPNPVRPASRNASSISVISADETTGAWNPAGNVSEDRPLDSLYHVGGSHPSAMAIVKRGHQEVLYVARANDDTLGLLSIDGRQALPTFDLDPFKLSLKHHQRVHGVVPNALVVSSDGTRLYVAEGGINSVAVLDTTQPDRPRLLGRIPTGWFPSGLALAGKSLYVINAYGVGEDLDPGILPAAKTGRPFSVGVVSAISVKKKKSGKKAARKLPRMQTDPKPTSEENDPFVDGNYLFGTAQKIDLASISPTNDTVLNLNSIYHPLPHQRVVPTGGKSSEKIDHVFFILKENKTFDSMLGSETEHFGPYASELFPDHSREIISDEQYTSVVPNARLLAKTFATAVNYFSDSEESDIGHQYAASGTASDYSLKTFLTKEGRGLLAQKNYDAEDYPDAGYIFNNAARNGVSFKMYGDMVRVAGIDKGDSVPTTLNDPQSGKAGLPKLNDDGAITKPLENLGDVETPTQGVGLSFFVNAPILNVLGDNNLNGEPHLDGDYPGYNFNISDQRRALHFIADYDRMVKSDKLPRFCFIYLPNDHTGGLKAPNSNEFSATGMQQVADGDVALGMIVQHIMSSSAYYNPKSGKGSAIFITWDDSQSTRDHIHPHRTPLIVVSPYVKPGYLGKRHYSTSSIVKTEELMLGLPPNNFGDLLATDLRDLFQDTPNGILPPDQFSRVVQYQPSPEAEHIWKLAVRLDNSGPDRDSRRLGELNRLAARADLLHARFIRLQGLASPGYRAEQTALYREALAVVTRRVHE